MWSRVQLGLLDHYHQYNLTMFGQKRCYEDERKRWLLTNPDIVRVHINQVDIRNIDAAISTEFDWFTDITDRWL